MNMTKKILNLLALPPNTHVHTWKHDGPIIDHNMSIIMTSYTYILQLEHDKALGKKLQMLRKTTKNVKYDQKQINESNKGSGQGRKV